MDSESGDQKGKFASWVLSRRCAEVDPSGRTQRLALPDSLSEAMKAK